MALILDDTAHPEVRAECIRVARRLRLTGNRVVGLIPASDRVGVVPAAAQLGAALVEVSGAAVALLDANVRWPAICEPIAELGGATPSVFATHWLRPSLALLTPRRTGGAGAGLPLLGRMIGESAELFAHLLVDLTGYRELGEYLGAVDLVDGVLVVARVGVTRDDDLLRMNHALPAAKNIGVLLVGGDG
ncbi:MAG: hypothetical protein EXR72_11910 [Myxococcales bacterium]|nr:hypothetical protein [Myxococcales bacterium]